MLTKVVSVAAILVAGWLCGRSEQDEAPASHPSAAEHRWLAEDVGTWKAVLKTMSPPDRPGPEFEGVATITMFPGGFWQIMDYRQKDGGVSTHRITGWDPKKKKFVVAFLSSFAPSMVQLEGTLDASGKVLTLERADGASKEVFKRKDRGHCTLEIHYPWTSEDGKPTGNWDVGLVIELTRS